MATLTHQEKDQIIKELKEKLKEMKSVETQVTSLAADLSQFGVGIHRNEKGNFVIAKLKYDAEKNAAAIESLQDLGPDWTIAIFKAKEYLVETILAKAKGSKYV